MKLVDAETLDRNEKVYSYTLPFGMAGVAYVKVTATDSAILRVEPASSFVAAPHSDPHPALRQALAAYLAGKPIEGWPVTVALSGSPFLMECWQELARVPYGETITYSQLAERAGNPKAIRAAASACARNPVPILIPCHRIIAKSGGLGGFGWGLPVKKALLALESHTGTTAKAA